MKTLLKKFWQDEAGLETIEYAIIAALIVIGAVAFLKSIGSKVEATFEKIDEDFPDPS